MGKIMNTIEKLNSERNEVREILEDFQNEFENKDFKNINRIFNLINADEKLINDLTKENKECYEKLELVAKEGGKSETKRIVAENNLNKAKAIIKNLLDLPYEYCNILTVEAMNEMKKDINEAEDFIKE